MSPDEGESWRKSPAPRCVCCGRGPDLLYWGQVMKMNRERTGMLIAEARKQKNMTQKDLAAALHVSDRAVSKWERGAGFPDVSLLEPLADALGLQVLELLPLFR